MTRKYYGQDGLTAQNVIFPTNKQKLENGQ